MPWSHCGTNKNVFSSCLKRLYDKFRSVEFPEKHGQKKTRMVSPKLVGWLAEVTNKRKEREKPS